MDKLQLLTFDLNLNVLARIIQKVDVRHAQCYDAQATAMIRENITSKYGGLDELTRKIKVILGQVLIAEMARAPAMLVPGA